MTAVVGNSRGRFVLLDSIGQSISTFDIYRYSFGRLSIDQRLSLIFALTAASKGNITVYLKNKFRSLSDSNRELRAEKLVAAVP